MVGIGKSVLFPQAHRKPFGWKATTARCPCWSPRLPCSCSPLAALVLYVNRSTIIAIILLILRSFQRKGLCNSGLKAKSTTFVRNITTIRLRSQFVILKMDINMTDKIGKRRAANCVYHIGASIKDLGKKWFGLSKMEILTPDELVERINRE